MEINNLSILFYELYKTIQNSFILFYKDSINHHKGVTTTAIGLMVSISQMSFKAANTSKTRREPFSSGIGFNNDARYLLANCGSSLRDHHH